LAGIQKLPSGRFQVRYRGPDGKQYKRSFDREREATAFAGQMESSRARGEWMDPAAGKVTLERLWTRWRPDAPYRASHLATYDVYWRTQVGPKLGAYPLARITKQVVQRFLSDVQRESGSAWVTEHAFRLLRKLLMEAMDAELIVRNPATRVRLPKKPKRHTPTVLTPQEIGGLAREVPPHWRALVLVNAYGAMRWSEVVGLTVGSVDWGRRLISVTETVVEAAGHLYKEPTKTEAGRRTITLPGFVMEALAEHIRRWPPGDLGLIFHDRNGQPVRRSTFYRTWRQATERAGLPGFKVRNLRHTGASLAVASGADLEHLKVRMGHESIATTSRFYLQMYEGRDAEIAQRLEELADDPDSQRRLRGMP
jgi:integrase